MKRDTLIAETTATKAEIAEMAGIDWTNYSETVDGIVSGMIADPVGYRVFKGGLLIRDGFIESVLSEEEVYSRGNSGESIMEVGWILPGLVDSHIHVESSMLSPWEFSRRATACGTVSCVCDPHEISNVLGIHGVEYMHREGEKTPMKFIFGAPSCVPATPFDSCAQPIEVEQIEYLFDETGLTFLGEMMNFPGVLNRDKGVMKKINAALSRGLPVDGHCPGLSGSDLEKYFGSGITTDHECFTLEEAKEKIFLGMKIQIREGSAVRNFEELIPLAFENADSCMFCSDDRHPEDLMKGHINLLVGRGLEKGIPILDLLKMASLNPVLHYRIPMGMLQQGDSADFITVSSLEEFIPDMTVISGRIVARSGESLMPCMISGNCPAGNSPPFVTAEELVCIPDSGRASEFPVIVVIPDQIVTAGATVDLVPGVPLQSDVSSDTLLIGVIDRYGKSRPGLGLVRGFGLKKGAIASTVCHDSHNLIFVSADIPSALAVINGLAESGGGIAVAQDGRLLELLPLPIAGLMSEDSCEDVAEIYEALELLAKKLGTSLQAPFMTLSFMALLVIPSLKIGPMGPFDVKRFTWV